MINLCDKSDSLMQQIEKTMASQIIVLNGTSSAGKSSIAKEQQCQFKETYLHIQMDDFLRMIPEGKKDYDDLFCKMVEHGITDSIKPLLDLNYKIILDTVFTSENMQVFNQRMNGFDANIVAVTSSLETLKKRERIRGDRDIGLAESQYSTIHNDIEYDFTVDTTDLTAKQSAEKIIGYLSSHPNFS